jgi:hypothetical protein
MHLFGKRWLSRNSSSSSWVPLQECLEEEERSEFVLYPQRSGAGLNVYRHKKTGVEIGLDDRGRCFVFRNGCYELSDFKGEWQNILTRVELKQQAEKQRLERSIAALVIQLADSSPKVRRKAVVDIRNLRIVDNPVLIDALIATLEGCTCSSWTDGDIGKEIVETLADVPRASDALEAYNGRREAYLRVQEAWRERSSPQSAETERSSGGSSSGEPSAVRGGDPNDPMRPWYGDSDRGSGIDERTLNGDRGIGGTF